jgi:tetratricopeptide (TPR) repeat protein
LPPQQPGALFTTPTAQLPSEPGVDGMAAGPVSLPGLSLQPGGDVFTDMQLALELSRNPQPEWYSEIFTPPGTEVAEAPTEDPTLSLERQARAAQSAEQFLTRMFEAPLQTFVGDSATAVNHELRQAEAAMSLGRYYDAVRHYERVCVLDPANPLPLIGKGHALLAAGEYVSAAVSLIAGLERFPDLARFHEDLAALMGGGEIVDIRRAGLMRQLERNEDPQLRFLLGYLEVHSNLVEFGMQNLEKAAREAEPGSLIRRYPDMIRHKVWLSPELPSDEIDRPAPPDSGSPATEPTISEEGAR